MQHDPEHEFHPSTNLLTVKHARSQIGPQPNSTAGRWLQNLVIEIALRIAVPNNPEDYAKQVFGQEAGFDRAINFSDPLTPLKNILGDKPKFQISDWQPESPGDTFPLMRVAPWSEGLDVDPKPREKSRVYDSLGDGDPPKALLDFATVKHTERRVFSLIDMGLWDRAGWQGMAYAFGEDLSEPAILALAFTNPEPAREIFMGWLSRLGKVDEKEELHISLITGIDRKNPFSYAVVIGSNPALATDTRMHHFLMVSRIQRMTPQDSRNLDQFVSRFERIGRYLLVPAHLVSGGQSFKMLLDLWIGKRAIRVLPAWQLKRNDPDAIALKPDDDPIIPEGIEGCAGIGCA